MNGTIFNIQRFCINDGPGIRTTVFLKGCPLKCIWCHNPESQAREPEIMFYKDKCTKCGGCVNVTVNDSDFVCFNDAKEICGKEISSDEVIKEVLKDEIFYKNSGGGITISGGEPFYQFDFSLELVKKAKENGLHTAIETCGFVKNSNLKKIAEFVDLFLYDYKETNSEKHKNFTGVDNTVIIDNLSFLNNINKDVILRCPIIKGCNDRREHFEGIAEIANRYKNILHIEIEPYHSLGEGKYSALGKKVQKFSAANEKEKNEYLLSVQKNSFKKVKFS